MRRRVDSPRNSTSTARLADLDWDNWWTDTTGGAHYLHVAHKDGETIHRVFCRKADRPRLRLIDGTLYWLIDDAVRAADNGSAG